jgi:putative ABC transport system permease protein
MHINWGFLLIALGLAMATGILFGLAPALLAFRPQFRAKLADSARSTGGAERHRLRDALVVAEIGLAIVLLHAGGLMLKSLSQVMNTNPGFRSDHLLTFELTLPANRYPKDADEVAVHRRLLDTLSTLPGVQGAATTSTLPLTGGNNTSRFVREGHRTPGETESQEANSRDVSANYFSVMGIPLRAGRLFGDHDTADTTHVALINQTLADRMFPGEDPIGKRIDFTYTPTPNLWEIVGVVGDENATALDARTNPVIYTPFSQSPDTGLDIVVRTGHLPDSLAPSVARAIRQLDPAIPVYNMQSMDNLIGDSPSIFLRRSPAYLIAGFGGLGLLLAAFGLYSLLAYAVSQRMRELGIRMALGAQKSDVLALIVGGGMRLVVAGIALGAACALAVSRLLAGFLYQVQPGDLSTVIGVCFLLILVTLAATAQPAWRASTADPMLALREE